MTNDPYTPEPDVKGRTAEQAGEVKDHALREATDVKDHATGAARDVAQTAGSEAKSVARDARREFRGLVDTGLNELNTQLGTGQNRLAEQLREVVTELGEMAEGSQRSGLATQAAQELSSRGQRLAGWLDTHEPRDGLDELRRYAARNPWTFLALAAGAGLLVGRFARGLRDDSSDDDTTWRRSAYGTQSGVGMGYSEPPRTGTNWTSQPVGGSYPTGTFDPAATGPTGVPGGGYSSTTGLAGAAGYPNTGETGTLGASGGGYPGTSQAGPGYPNPSTTDEARYRPGAAGQNYEAQFGEGQYGDPGERR